MKEKIKAYAKQLHIEYLGIAMPDQMVELKKRLILSREKYGVTPFEEPDIEKRTNPFLAMENAKSIIVCLFPYYNGGAGAENVSVYARIPDYHRVVHDYLGKICDFLQKEVPECNLMPFADNGSLADKYLAYLAGLGYFGKNTLLINEKYGSFCFIGYILTDLSLDADKPLALSCGDCTACIKACPGKALDEHFGINAKRCVSYITQSKEITEEQEEILQSQSYVYGCDTCQNVCPQNRDLPVTPILEFAKPTLEVLEQSEIALLSGKEFKRRFSEYPFTWCGKKAILKNFGK